MPTRADTRRQSLLAAAAGEWLWVAAMAGLGLLVAWASR
jgi:hypothetical protein